MKILESKKTMDKEYYYEENYPDCLGEFFSYNKQPGCLTCLWKKDCEKELKIEKIRLEI